MVQFKSVTEAFYAGAVGAMVVYDISRRSTFDELGTWLEHLRNFCHKSIGESLLVGTGGGWGKWSGGPIIFGIPFRSTGNPSVGSPAAVHALCLEG